MYIVQKNNNITMNRGDYFSFPIKLIKGEFPNQSILQLEDGDFLYFKLMYPNQKFEEAILTKRYTSSNEDSEGNVYVTFEPEDTLFLNPGTYYYEVKILYKMLDNSNPRVETVIQKTRFYIV